jgi:uncharacterized protein
MNFTMMKFISVILLLMFSAHYFLYISWVRFFDVPPGHGTENTVCRPGIPVCHLCILASISIHVVNHPVTRSLLPVFRPVDGASDLHPGGHFFLWVVKTGLTLFPDTVSGPRVFLIFSVICYGLAILYTGFCHYQFYRITIRPVQIPVRHLPDHWENKKIIHLSDLHLGAAQDIRFLERVVFLTNREKADLIVITGDLFDGAVPPRSVVRYLPLLETLKAEQGVFFTSGNHEVYSGVREIRQMIESSTMTLLDNRAVILAGIQLLGLSFPEFRQTDVFDFSDPEKFNPDLPTILLYHTPTRIRNNDTGPAGVQSADYLAPDTTFSAAVKQGVFLQLSGHTHAGQFFPYTWIAGRIFKGFHYGLHRIGHFYINISSGTGSWGPPLRSGHLSEIGVITLVKER